VALAGEVDRGGDSPEISLAPSDGKDSQTPQSGRDERVEELRLPHPPELAWIDGICEEEPVEVRELVRREDEAAAGHVLESAYLGAEENAHDRSADCGHEPIENSLRIRSRGDRCGVTLHGGTS
jgi:hypothetical protein